MHPLRIFEPACRDGQNGKIHILLLGKRDAEYNIHIGTYMCSRRGNLCTQSGQPKENVTTHATFSICWGGHRVDMGVLPMNHCMQNQSQVAFRAHAMACMVFCA